MVYSIGKKSPYDTDPVNEVIGGEAAWADLRFQDPEAVDRLAKIPGRVPLGQGYAVAPDSAPKSFLWKSTSKRPPAYAFGNNSVMLVSSRFRDLVDQFEPGVHQFLPVNVYSSKTATEPFDQYYWFVVCNLIDSINPERTTLTWRGEYDERIEGGLRRGFWKYDHDMSPPPRAVFDLKRIGNRQLWRDPYYTRDYVNCSDTFGDAMIASGLSGFALRRYEQV